METICTDLYIGDNWKLSQQPDGSLGYSFYESNSGAYVLTNSLPAPPSSEQTQSNGQN